MYKSMICTYIWNLLYLNSVCVDISQLLERTSKTETAYVQDEDVEIDQSGITDITQNISSHSAATEDGKKH